MGMCHTARMSHIYVISPSSAVRVQAPVKRAVKRLRAMGHEIELDTAVFARNTRFAGDDAARLAAIQRAASSGADAVMITRGGYGLSRLLPDLPYKAMAKSIAKGTAWMGFSDFTALSLGLMAKTGAATWSAPALIEDFGQEMEPDDITVACWDDVLSGQGEGTGWRIGKNDPSEFVIQDALLWGGNLAVLASLVGTPYLPQVSKGILFLEDVGEQPYRVERLLTQLWLSGVLAQQKAIVLGAFTGQSKTVQDKGFDMNAVVAWLRAHTKAKVLTGLPYGHVRTKVTLPVGLTVDLAVQGREALLMWAHDH